MIWIGGAIVLAGLVTAAVQWRRRGPIAAAIAAIYICGAGAIFISKA